MKLDSKEVGFGVFAVIGGICLIVTARLTVGHLSWGARSIINAIGWITIAAVIIPLCDQIKSRGGKK